MARISFKIDGEIVPGNKISMRSLGVITSNFQLAINRAYLEVKHGPVQKYKKIGKEDYLDTQFMMSDIRENCLIIDFISGTNWGDRAARKISDILDVAYRNITAGYEHNYFGKKTRVERARDLLDRDALVPMAYARFAENPPAGFTNSYTDKSVVRNVSASITPIRSTKHIGSVIEIEIESSGGTQHFVFNHDKAKKLHWLVSEEQLLSPVMYNGYIYAMDENKDGAEFENLESNRSRQRLIFTTEEDFEAVRRVWQRGKEYSFIAMPKAEYSSLDLVSGDVVFVRLVGDVG